jgi:hypothetical protein
LALDTPTFVFLDAGKSYFRSWKFATPINVIFRLCTVACQSAFGASCARENVCPADTPINVFLALQLRPPQI